MDNTRLNWKNDFFSFYERPVIESTAVFSTIKDIGGWGGTLLKSILYGFPADSHFIRFYELRIQTIGWERLYDRLLFILETDITEHPFIDRPTDKETEAWV